MGAGEYNHELCDEKHANIWAAIKALRIEKEKLERKIAFFNLTGVGILVSILTGLFLSRTGG